MLRPGPSLIKFLLHYFDSKIRQWIIKTFIFVAVIDCLKSLP